MDFTYLPALSPGALTTEEEGLWAAHWMDSRLPPEMQHFHLLASYGLWKDKDLPPVWTHRGFVFGDSGGFSVVSAGANVDPERALLWQIRNCHAGVILDIPPYDFGGKSQFTGSSADRWHECIKRTIGNVQRALPLYNAYLSEKSGFLPPAELFAWYGVVQGEDYSQLEEWYEAVAAVYPFNFNFEGWAMAPKPCNDTPTVVRFLRLVKEKKIRRVHVLQTAAAGAVAVMVAFAKMAGVESLTHDSASVHINTANRNIFYRRPGTLDGVWLGLNGVHHEGWPAVFKYTGKYCKCYACQAVQYDWKKGKEIAERDYRHRLLLHNFLAMRELEKAIHAAVEIDPEKVVREVAKDRTGQLLREFGGHSQKPKALQSVSILDRV